MRTADQVGKTSGTGVDRTYAGYHETDASDPRRTLAKICPSKKRRDILDVVVGRINRRMPVLVTVPASSRLEA